jgi:hypothetical protein
VASEHGDDYDNNNPLQRLILPLILTPEAEIQMVVNVFELAGACIFLIIIRNKPQQLIGEQFIASNNSAVGFQLVVESILILHSEEAQVASASLQTFADGDQAASQSDISELIVTQLLVEYNLQAPSSALIVGYRSSKISFHFCGDCRTFCEGEREQINKGDANVKQRRISLDDLISLVGFIGLSGISDLVVRISLVGRIGLDGWPHRI